MVFLRLPTRPMQQKKGPAWTLANQPRFSEPWHWPWATPNAGKAWCQEFRTPAAWSSFGSIRQHLAPDSENPGGDCREMGLMLMGRRGKGDTKRCVDGKPFLPCRAWRMRVARTRLVVWTTLLVSHFGRALEFDSLGKEQGAKIDDLIALALPSRSQVLYRWVVHVMEIGQILVFPGSC